MKNDKVLKKLEDLNLHERITFLISGKIEVIVKKNKLSDIDFRSLLAQFKPEKYILKLFVEDNKLILEINKITSLQNFSTDPALIPGFPSYPWKIRPTHRRL